MGVWKKYFLIVFLSALLFSLPIIHAEQLNLTYDANGNLLTGDGFYREYNSLNQLWKVYNGSNTNLQLLEYTYDPIEERVLIKDEFWPNGSIRETTYYISKTQVIVVNSSGQYEETYVYHNNQLVAQVDFAGNKEFILTDHLGSSTVITDENGTVIENSTYAPFGQLITGGTSRYDYEGKEQNEITGELDFNFRTYNPELALFTQPDSLLPNVYDPQHLNRVSFEKNNAYKYTDLTGHFPVVFLASEPIFYPSGLVLGKGEVIVNPDIILSKNSIIPRVDPRSGLSGQILRRAGYENIENLNPSDPFIKVLKRDPRPTMLRGNSNDGFDVLRFDKAGTLKGREIGPHLNQESWRVGPSGNFEKTRGGDLNHLPYFTTIVSSNSNLATSKKASSSSKSFVFYSQDDHNTYNMPTEKNNPTTSSRFSFTKNQCGVTMSCQ